MSPRILSILLILALGVRFGASASEPIEGAPILLAREILPAEVLKGEHYSVHGVVVVEDYEYIFRLTTPFGTFAARGMDELNQRIREIKAIAALSEISQTEAFASSLGRTFTDPVFMTVGVARRPVSTVTGIPVGLSRYLQGKLYQVRRHSDRAIAFFQKKESEEEGADSDALHEGEESKGTLTQKVGSSAGSLSRRHLGYNDAKRNWARRFQVDPYSDNKILQGALNRIAWSSSLGGFAGDAVMPSTEVFSYAGQANEIVWEKPPLQIERANGNVLKKLGIERERILEFTEAPTLSLTEKASICISLAALGPIENVDTLVDMSLGLETREDARVFVRTVQMLECYCRYVSSIERIEIRSGLITADGSNGYLIVPLALDYLHWNELIAQSLASKELDSENRELWISGAVSTIAGHELRDRDWHVFQKCLDNVPTRAPRIDAKKRYEEAMSGR